MPQDLTDDVNIGSGNGLVPSGNKPLPEPMLTPHWRIHAALGGDELKCICGQYIDNWLVYTCSSFWSVSKSDRRFIVLSCEVSKPRDYWLNHLIASEFDSYIGNTATNGPVKFQSVCTILNTNLAASRLPEILQYVIVLVIETGRHSE